MCVCAFVIGGPGMKASRSAMGNNVVINDKEALSTYVELNDFFIAYLTHSFHVLYCG